MKAFNQSFNLLTLFVLLFLGSACAPLQVLDSQIDSSFILEVNEFDSLSDLEEEKASYKNFPVDNNQYVQKWLNYFSSGSGRESMKRYLERSRRYVDFMGSIFDRENLPKDLVYMSMVESGFYPYAKSKANAVGYWQFIKPTGQKYGLTINYHVDERQDFDLSTRAAVRYLKDLYDLFQDWRLSMAAYNCGPGCVREAVHRHNSRNFWYLLERKAIPPETRNYVPKIIAMREIALRPSSYGFYHLNYKEKLDYGLARLQGPSSLTHISTQLNVPREELKALNPKFKTDRVPFEGGKSYIRVPAWL